MCSVFGSIASKKLPLKTFKSINLITKNRGPDNTGYFTAEVDNLNLYLGHNRLKIQDLSDSANQPFENHKFAIVFNGEIYNFKELVKEYSLKNKLKTSSDTEVILLMFELFGIECFAKFDGPFSIAIYDKQQQKIFLSRDPFGEKPLFFSLDKGFHFSTSEKQLSALLWKIKSEIKISNTSFKNYVSCGYSNFSIFKNIKEVKPGECLEFDFASMKLSRMQFHTFSYHEEEEFCFEKFETFLVKSLKRRLISDLEVKLLFSGGLDSTYIAALLKKYNLANIKLIYVEDDLKNESGKEIAKLLAKDLKFHLQIVTSDAAKRDKYLSDNHKLDNLSLDPALISLCELYGESTGTVFLSGDGADECYLSYSNYKNLIKNESKIKYDFFNYLISVIPDSKIKNFLITNLPINNSDKISHYIGRDTFLSESYLKRCDELNIENQRALYLYSLEFELPYYLLRKSDSASMFFGKELRSPYLNKDLMQYCISSNAFRFLQDKQMINDRINKILNNKIKLEKKGMSSQIFENVNFSSINKHHKSIKNFFRNIFSRRRYLNQTLIENWINQVENNLYK